MTLFAMAVMFLYATLSDQPSHSCPVLERHREEVQISTSNGGMSGLGSAYRLFRLPDSLVVLVLWHLGAYVCLWQVRYRFDRRIVGKPDQAIIGHSWEE